MTLDALVAVLLDNPTVIIELRSHTDFRAGTEFNMILSQTEPKCVLIICFLKELKPLRNSNRNG